MLEFVIRPIQSVLGVTEHEVVGSVHEVRDIEADMLPVQGDAPEPLA